MPFPSTDDLTHLSVDDARRALRALRIFCDNELARVSDLAQPKHLLSHDGAHGPLHHEWYVYLAISKRHLPLASWANEWLAEQDTTPPFGGDAA